MVPSIDKGFFPNKVPSESKTKKFYMPVQMNAPQFDSSIQSAALTMGSISDRGRLGVTLCLVICEKY